MNHIGGHTRERVETNDISIADACKRKAQIWGDALHFNEKAYKMAKCGEGKEHFVHVFTEKEPFVINGSELGANDIILKRYHHNIKARDLPRIMREEIAAYHSLVSNNIPVPFCYATPLNVVDPAYDKSGGFWILQKMPTAVEAGVTDKKILAQARVFFNLNANSIHNGNGEVINDLRPPNVMLDKTGLMHVVDFSPVCTETEEARNHLNHDLNSWANGNQTIFDYLTEEFPEPLKNAMSMTKPVTIDDLDDSF